MSNHEESGGLKSGQRDDAGVLHVVATPIGNLEDISRRAVDVLSSVALIAAEDTRQTLKLLSALGLPRPKMVSLHEHNEAAAGESVLAVLRRCEDVALVSDAGTPLLSDPGFALIRRCHEEGIPVRPVPGPSALITALSVCPIPTAGFRFVGFLPARSTARRTRLEELLRSGDPVVFFEAPHRLRDCLADLDGIASTRRVFVAREMTKKFETYLCDLPRELIDRMDAAEQWRGEVVCVLEGVRDGAGVDLDTDRVMRALAAELSPAQAARLGAVILGRRKSELYELIQRGRKSDQ